jgi:hypothetical protein
MKRLLFALIFLAFAGIVVFLVHPPQTVNATSVQCIGPGPCVIPVAPPSTCQQGGTPSGPFQSPVGEFNGTGIQAVLKIPPVTNCQAVITVLEADLTGTETTVQVVPFEIWQTGDSTCGTPDGNILLAGDAAIGPYTPISYLPLETGGPHATAQNTTQNVCIGFAYALSGAYEKFNVSYAYR